MVLRGDLPLWDFLRGEREGRGHASHEKRDGVTLLAMQKVVGSSPIIRS